MLPILPTWELVVRLLLSAALGSVIGLERERLRWAAGLRTHMLVSVGSCLVMIVSAFGFGDIIAGDHVSLDPSRIAAQVVSGIGFLGAGSIILRGDKIRGLTTAASLWTVSGIGLAVGGGMYTASIASTVIILGILAGIKPFEERYIRHRQSVLVKLKARRGEISFEMIDAALSFRDARLRQLIVTPSEAPDVDNVTINFDRVRKNSVGQLTDALRDMPCVLSVDEAQV